MSAIGTFRRAMRRHEGRARRAGLRDVADIVCYARSHPGSPLAGMLDGVEGLRLLSEIHRKRLDLNTNSTAGHLFSLAADAVARLRGMGHA